MERYLLILLLISCGNEAKPSTEPQSNETPLVANQALATTAQVALDGGSAEGSTPPQAPGSAKTTDSEMGLSVSTPLGERGLTISAYTGPSPW